MYDFQSTVLIEAKPTSTNWILRIITSVLAVLGVLAAVLVFGIISFLLPVILLIALWYWVWFRSGLEYEYAYFDGDIDIDKIIDKRKRKRVISINMEDVEQIAPAGDRSLYNVHQDPKTKCMDLSSRKEGGRFYEIVVKEESRNLCICFEPDEKFLDHICVKYPKKVIR